MKHSNGEMKIPILSFFTGGGFMDMGFEKAGFRIVFTNEMDEDFAVFYKEGMSSWSGRQREIDIVDSINNVSNQKIKSFLDSPLFGVVGGPPCQDFSIRGSKAGFNGLKGTLTYRFYEKIMDLKPSFFLMENVPGLVLLKKTKDDFFSILDLFKDEYLIDTEKLNALHYGVPQFRERFFVFGIKKEFFNDFPLNSPDDFHFPWPLKAYPDAETKYNWGEPLSRQEQNKTVDLPPPPPKLCVSDIIIEDDSGEIPNANEFFNLRKPEKIKKIEEGDTYRPSFKRLHRNKYSPTACYGNNEVHLHPIINRRLSVRESLRIQGVPDEYVISTTGNLTKKFKMIGNGVPVPLAYNIAESIRSFLFSNFLKEKKLDGYLVQEEAK